MESTHFKISTKELILKQDREGGGTETFVYEPSNIEEERFGNLYIIGRLENRKSEFEFLPNLVASVIRREFYKLNGGDVESHFENALKKANATLRDIGKANEGVLEDAHFCVANIADKVIRLSKFGTMSTLLCRADEIVDMAKKYKRQNKNELFSAVITGDIALDDKLIFGTGKAIDLFSEKGIKKLFTLSLDEQADIISKIYQKNAQEIPLPAQALILLAIVSAKTTWLPFGKNREAKMNVAISAQKHFARIAAFMKHISRIIIIPHTFSFRGAFKKIASYSRVPLHKRNTLIFFILTMAFAAGGSGYSFFRTQLAIAEAIQTKISIADKTAAENKYEALALFLEARDSALRALPSFLLESLAKKLLHEIEVKINLLNGIHITPPTYLGEIPTTAIKFQPLFIFDTKDIIYVFGNTPTTIYTISKHAKNGTYVFLPNAPDNFEIEKMFMRDSEFYMLNNTKRSAFIFSPADTAFTAVKKTLQNTLATQAAQNAREQENAAYVLEGKNKILKTTKQKDGKTEKYLLGALRGVIDFTISFDQKEIYLLTAHAVFSIPH